MAVLGAQLVTTLVMISVIQKLGQHFSIARWLLCSTGLTRYLYPTDQELRQVANVPKDKTKGKKGAKHNQQNGNASDTFQIPRGLDVTLDTVKVSTMDVIHLKYYYEYQWLLDFAMYAVIVYGLTETYQHWFPIRDEINLSMLWCGLVLMFAFKILLSLTIQYFKGEESVGERSTCIVMAFVYLLVAMIILIVDESKLEIGLEKAYNSFNMSASAFLSKQGLYSSGPASKLVLKFFIAVWCAMLGTLFTFPGLRIAKMHWDLVKKCKDRRLMQLLLNISFALPFISVLFWVKPISRNYLTIRVFSGMTGPLLTDRSFDSIRFGLIIVTMLIKLILAPWYFQTYLDMAYHRVEMQKKEAGRISNKDFQKKIAAVFYYLCVVTLQYLAPIILCLYMTFMYKTLGEHSWIGKPYVNEEECAITNRDDFVEKPQDGGGASSIIDSAQDFQLALENFKLVFSPDVFRGLFGFGTWWCCFIYFTSTSLGLMYQTYFTETY